MEKMRQLTRLKTVRRGRRARPVTLLVLLFGTVFLLFLLQWLYSLPPPKFGPQTPQSCRYSKEGYVLSEEAICTETCGRVCFPRVHGICFGHSKVTICDGQSQFYSEMPKQMRFHMEEPRKRVPERGGLPWMGS